ncbi:MAG: WD40/YVTN/BNR-like repeat-containing protein [Acidimicrobiales bacterium]
MTAATAATPARGDAARRRRLVLTVGLLLLASVGAGIAAVAVVSSGSPSTLKVNPGSRGSGGGALNGGAVVPAADLVSDPVFVNSTVGFALATTEHGSPAVERLAESTDAGHTWHVTGSQFPVSGTFSTLQFISSSDGYIFGPAGLLVTTDGGKSWQEVQGLNGRLQRAIPLLMANGQLDVWATYTTCSSGPSCTVGVAVSTDSGHEWSDVSPPGLTETSSGGDILARWSLDAAYVLSYSPSGGGGLAYTSDDGKSWTHLVDPCSGAYTSEDMAAPPPDTPTSQAPARSTSALWLICGARTSPGETGQPKLVYRSYDGGRKWSLVASTGFAGPSHAPVGEIPLSGAVSQLATINTTQAWLGVSGLGVIVTLDSGEIWQLADGIPTNEPDTAVGVTFNSGVLGWVVVFRRGVWRTEDAVHWALMDGS